MMEVSSDKGLQTAYQAETKESSNSRLKLYLIFIFISLILLFISIWQAKPIIAEPGDFFGLASHFTPCYWVGLTLLLFCSIRVFLDKGIKRDYIFIFILLVLGLFLYGITVFGVENARNVTVYYPTAEVNNLLATHHFDPAESYSLLTYRSWPAIHFLSASILLVPGLELDFVKYVPLFWMLCFVFITYSIGKRLGLPANRCFLLSFLTLSSTWILATDYSPQGIALILYLLCFMFMLPPRRSTAENIMAILAFTALVLLHSITAVAVLLPVVILSIYRKEPGFIALFFVIFFAWYMYQNVVAFESSVTSLWSNPFTQFFQVAEVGRYVAPKPLPALVNRYMQLSYLGMYGVGTVIALGLSMVRSREQRKRVMPAFYWLIGLMFIILIAYGDFEWRLFIFSLVPAAGIILLSFSSQKLLIGLMVVFLTLSLPARYGADAVWGQVLTTELAGAKFVALEVKPETSLFYDRMSQLIFHYDPGLVMHYTVGSFVSASVTEISKLDDFDYVIISKQTRDRSLWLRRSDPYRDWLQTEAGERADLIYNNGYYQVYVNQGAE